MDGLITRVEGALNNRACFPGNSDHTIGAPVEA